MSVELQVDDGIVVLAFRGSVTTTDALHAQSEAAAMLREKGILLLLVDVTEVKCEVSYADMFRVNASHSQIFPPATRHAVVYDRNRSTREQEDMHFAENVAVNRGAIMQYFDDFAKAREWLKRETAK